jgi:two-component response regulator ARR-A family
MPELTKIILLADDDPEDQEILEEAILKMEPSAKLQKVDSGKEALDYLLTCSENNLPCLIILDYSMPVLNASEVLEEIGHRLHLQNIPKVVWSSSKQPEHVQRCMDRGAIGYFAKPNKMSELTSIARQMLDLCYNGKVN